MNKLLLTGFVALLAATPSYAATLEEAMAKAYANNPGLAAQRAQLGIADEQVDQAQAGWRPRVNGVVSAGKLYTKTPNNTYYPDHGTHTPRAAGIEVVQPVFSGFRTINGVEAASKQSQAARAMVQAAEQQLLLNVGKAYLDVLRDQKLVELYRHNREVLDMRATETRKRFSVGEVTQTDVLQAQARLEGTKTGLTQAEGQLESDNAAYLRYVGGEPQQLSEPKLEYPVPATLDDMIALSLKRNPAITAAACGEEAAIASVDVSRGALLPQLDLVGSVSRGWDQGDFVPGRQDNSQVMLRLTIPLYNAGVEYSQTRAARHAATQKRMELEDMRLAVRQAAVGAWSALKTAQSATSSSRSQVAANEKALEGVKKEASVGTRTTLDILNAEQELLAAKVNLVQSRHDEAVALLQARAVIGDLTASALALPTAP